MKVLDYIKSSDKNKLFCIGASGSYMFIGTAERFLKDYKTLDEINIAKVNKYLKNRKSTLRNLELGYPNMKFTVDKCNEDISRFEDYIANYIPIGDREVNETYSRLTDLATVLMVSGDEQGSYWFQFEYDCGFLYDTNKDFKSYVSKFADEKRVRPPEIFSYAAVREYADYIYSK